MLTCSMVLCRLCRRNAQLVSPDDRLRLRADAFDGAAPALPRHRCAWWSLPRSGLCLRAGVFCGAPALPLLCCCFAIQELRLRTGAPCGTAPALPSPYLTLVRLRLGIWRCAGQTVGLCLTISRRAAGPLVCAGVPCWRSRWHMVLSCLCQR